MESIVGKEALANIAKPADPVESMRQRLAGGTDTEKSMAGIYSAIWAQKCTFCKYSGHTAKQWAFKKNIGRSF